MLPKSGFYFQSIQGYLELNTKYDAVLKHGDQLIKHSYLMFQLKKITFNFMYLIPEKGKYQ